MACCGASCHFAASSFQSLVMSRGDASGDGEGLALETVLEHWPEDLGFGVREVNSFQTLLCLSQQLYLPLR